MSRTAPIISEAKRMLRVGMTSYRRSDAGLVVDAGVEVDVAQDVFLQWRFAECHRQSAEAPPVVRHRAAAVRNDEAQGGEVREQVALDELHERRGVGVEVVRAGGVEGRVDARADMDHRRDVVLHHLLVDGVPGAVGERWRGPVAARGVGVEVDRHGAELLYAAGEFGDAGGGVHAG
jgi:hypothetical protein